MKNIDKNSWESLMNALQEIEKMEFNVVIASNQEASHKAIYSKTGSFINISKATPVGENGVRLYSKFTYFKTPEEKMNAIYESIVDFHKWFDVSSVKKFNDFI